MNKISIKCPSCEAVLKVSPEVIGKKARCPKCKTVVPLLKPAGTKGPTKNESLANKSKGSGVDETVVTSKSAGASSAKPTQNKSPAVKKPKKAGGESSTKGSIRPQAAVPMAKLLPKDSPDRESKIASRSTEDVDFAALESASQTPRVKFKRKRTNPLPTIILGVIAISVLGIAVALIAILQGGGNPTVDPNAVPEIVFVADVNTDLGQQVSIPIKVKYPPAMTMQQTKEWEITIGEEAPEGATYDSESSSVVWEPNYKHAGTRHLIPVLISNPNTNKSDVTRFSVSVGAIPEGERQFLAWAQSMEVSGRAVNVSPKKIEATLSGIYRDASFEGITIRAFFYNDPSGPVDELENLDTESEAFQLAYQGLQDPLMVSPIQSMFLIGNMDEVKSNTAATELFNAAPKQLPTEATEQTLQDTDTEPENTAGDED